MNKGEITARFRLLEYGENVPSAGQQREKDADEMMWIRHCPHCKKKMCKYTLQYPIPCDGCGWVWQ